MRTKTWSSVCTAQLKERVPGACLPRKLMATISQTRTAITFSVVHQTSFQEQFRKAWKVSETTMTSNYLKLQLKWRVVTNVTSIEHNSSCVVTALTQHLQYQATASNSLYILLLVVVLLDAQKLIIVHLKPDLLYSLAKAQGGLHKRGLQTFKCGMLAASHDQGSGRKNQLTLAAFFCKHG